MGVLNPLFQVAVHLPSLEACDTVSPISDDSLTCDTQYAHLGALLPEAGPSRTRTSHSSHLPRRARPGPYSYFRQRGTCGLPPRKAARGQHASREMLVLCQYVLPRKGHYVRNDGQVLSRGPGKGRLRWKREFKLQWREAGPPNHHDEVL